MESELDFDRFGAWLLEHNLSIGVAPRDSGHRPFRVYRDSTKQSGLTVSRCVGQGSTLSQALREAGALGGTGSG
jgi:hypothetical protein